MTALPGRHYGGDSDVAEEESLRAAMYALLSKNLSAPPALEDLATAAGLSGDRSPLGRAIGSLARCAAATSVEQAREEYHTLFIGLGRGELVPYASYYLTGFLQEKPLAKLRQDMARLGLERDPSVSEPEDHVASILEIMGGMISGAYGAPLTLADQRRFYDTHLSPWMPVFFRDLEAVQSSAYFAGLGAVGRAFLAVEEQAFAVV